MSRAPRSLLRSGPTAAAAVLLTAALATACSGSPAAAPGAANAGLVAPPGFASATTPTLAWDGRHRLFAGRSTPDQPLRLWVTGADGSDPVAIPAGNGDPDDPAWLPDGRIVFSDLPSSGPAGSATGARALFSCAADGSDIRRLTWSLSRDERPAILPDGRIRFERRPAEAGPEAAGLPMTIHPDGTGLAFEAASGEAARFDPPSRGSKASDAGLPSRGVPPWRPPILTSVVRPDRTTGTLLCLDAGVSRLPSVAALKPGSITGVRVSRLSSGAAPELLGEAPVHPDGSFFVEVPADVPLRLALLGSDGIEIAAFQSGIWVRPNENRGCIGCHEDPRLAPENRQPLAVLEPPVSLVRPGPAAPMPGGAGGGKRLR